MILVIKLINVIRIIMLFLIGLGCIIFMIFLYIIFSEIIISVKLLRKVMIIFKCKKLYV